MTRPSSRRSLIIALIGSLVVVLAGLAWVFRPHTDASADSPVVGEVPQSTESPSPTYEAPQSLPIEAGQIRSPESCTPGRLGELGPADVLISVNGQPAQQDGQDNPDVPLMEATPELPQWTGKSQPERGRTSNTDHRLHLIGMAEDGTGLGNAQSLQPPAHPAATASGQVTTAGFTPFGPATFLKEQLPSDVQAAPIAGSVNQGHAVWLEQLVTGAPQRANEYPWRIMFAPFASEAPVAEVLSSWALTQSVTSPAPTAWRPPVTNGALVAAEYWELNTAKDQWEARVGLVSLDNPGQLRHSHQGRLPIAVGQDIAWVEDSTSFGIDAENDIFTLRWLNDTHPPLSMHTSAFAKVQWLEGNAHYLMIALQDSCTGMTWLGRYDRALEAFTAWVASEQDRIAASLNDNILVWGNGSGNRGAQMYRWDLNTNTVHTLGELEGYSVPFSAGQSATLIPSFTTEGGAPLVSWGWYSDFATQ